MNYPYDPNEGQSSSQILAEFLLWLAVIVVLAASIFYAIVGGDPTQDERNAATAFYPSRPSVEQQTAYREEMQAQADLIRATTARGAQ